MKCPFIIKKCIKCGKLLVANTINFPRRKDSKDGLRNYCKECNKEIGKKYREEHKDELTNYKKEYMKTEKAKESHRKASKKYRESENGREKINEYKKNHKEDIASSKKEWYENNKDISLERSQKHYKENREQKLNYQKQYYKDNKNSILEYRKEYHKKNPDKAFNSQSKRRSLIEIQENNFTKEQWLEMMEFFDWKCAYSGEKFNNNRTIDHIVPLSKNGEHKAYNLVPMLKNLNSSKHTKDMLEWYKEQPFFSEERLNKIYEWQEYAKNKWDLEDE